jgi:tRNA(His) guanylyltransferase
VSDDLGDRMKVYERAEAGRKFMPLLPIIARVDGRSFSSFTRGLDRPYDAIMAECMTATAEVLLVETNACCAYTQSDEITLAWHVTDPQSQVWFDGKIAKMVSHLGALATLHFYRRVVKTMWNYADRLPTFDARVWQVPNRTEGANVFLWREWDATKNSLTMAASAYYSHNELHEKNGAQKHDMLHAKGINWNDYPAFFKRGTFIQRKREMRPFNATELESLPPKHHARLNPDLAVERWKVGAVYMPPFTTVSNREAVIFDGADPECFSNADGGKP